ncbi:MAG: RNA methyltransferase [Lachnospiraceae bacterium]|nr:RNA methyltransferase [Lachnospiraceae bacterium]
MITAQDNSQVKYISKLLKSSKFRREEGVFIVEGPRMVSETPTEFLHTIYLSETGAKNFDYPGAEIISDKIYKNLSDTVNPQGVLAIVKMPKYNYEEVVGKSNALLIFLENLQDPGNLGTIMRTAEAAGCAGIIADKNTVDLFNPKVVRSTMGAIYRMPFVSVESLDDAVKKAKDKGVKFYAAHLKGKKTCYECDYKTSTAFLIGNEGNGLTDAAADLADEKILIPMDGKAESLNAAMATGILVYEAKRQRMII